MARVRAGDARAFAELYERHRAPLFTFLVHLTGKRHLAEDLLQETFLRVYRSRHDYKASGRFKSWLFTIARRLVVDDYRRARIPWDDEGNTLEEIVAAERAEHRVEAREQLERLERALDTLPPGQREILLLSRDAGLDAEEIARVTGATPGAVRVGLHRALRRLRAALGG